MRQLRAEQTGAPSVLRTLVKRLVRDSPWLVVLGTAAAILQSALLIPIALLIRGMFDSEIPRHHVSSIVLSGALILVLYATAAVLGYATRAAALRMAAGAVSSLRLDLLAKLHALPQHWHDRQRMATLQSIAVQDTERVEAMLATVAGNLLPAVIVGIALLVAALVISPILFLTGLAIIPPMILATRLMARRVRRLTRRWSESSRRFSDYVHVLLRAIVTTRIVGGEGWALRGGADHASEVSERHRQLGSAGAIVAAMEAAIAATAGTAVLVVGGIEVAQHSMKLGDLLAFYAVLGLLLRQVHSVGWQTGGVMIALQSLRDIDAVLAVDEAEPYMQGKRPIEFRGGVSLAGVSFSYGEEPVLRDLTLTLGPGEHVAVVGPNGAGKSTLVNLLLGLYEPDAGLLRADGVPYEDLDIRALRRQMGVVLQDPVLVPGSIRDNIAYARPELSDDAVRAAARAATAADFIEEFPVGYSTVIGDEGAGLSGGQRQRVAIARALLGRPALMVLDEPSTYLDDAAVTALMDGLMSLPYAPTVLLVTHDSQIAAHVTRVIELRAGRIIRDSESRPSISVRGA
jgi:ATP-binding cassette subfamily B protein